MTDYPVEFYLVMALAIGIAAWAVTVIRTGIGLPLLTVLGTVVFWYAGDVLYNDYETIHAVQFLPHVLANAWLQVGGFLLTLVAGVCILHPLINKDCIGYESKVYLCWKNGTDNATFQFMIDVFAKICLAIFAMLVLLAILNIGTETLYFLVPIDGSPRHPFRRGRLSTGALGAIFALATNFQVLAASGFGLVAALARDPRIRAIGIIGCLLTWPFFLLNRTRNTMLSVCVPAIMSWIFLRLRLAMPLKIGILILAVIAGDTWLRFVMEARDNQRSVAQYFFSSDISEVAGNESIHRGLNMYEELCWLNQFIENGNYVPNMGKRYFAEIVNPIPRGLWPGKPMIGIEYAVARGQKSDVFGAAGAGVGATISTGMIGQGVSNFGTIFGPIAAGLIMSLWVVILVRIDLHATSLWRLPLYAIGLALTFNCGRDITLLVLYPFFFGYIAVRIAEYRYTQKVQFR